MKLSVIVTTYNHERFVAQAVESVLAQQTDFTYEVLLADDCSTDGTLRILKSYEREHPAPVRVLVSSQNRGDQGMRFFGDVLNLCRGELLAWLDGDDFWTSPEKLQAQADLLDARPDLAMCFHDVVMVSEDATRVLGHLNPGEGKWRPTMDDLLRVNFVGGSSPMFRMSVLRPLPKWYFRMPWGDWPAYLIAARHGGVAYLDRTMGAYRLHRGGAWSALGRARQYQLLATFYRQLEPILEARYGSLVRELADASDQAAARVRRERSDWAEAVRNALGPWQRKRVLTGGSPETHPLLEALAKVEPPPGLEPGKIADCIAALPCTVAHGRRFDAWSEAYPLIGSFLTALECRSGSQGLAVRAQRELERLIVQGAPTPAIIGRTHVMKVEITEPIPDIRTPENVDRLHCTVTIEGEPLGELQLPVCDQFIPADVLADAIADAFAWQVLGRFFGRTIYPSLRIERGSPCSVWRGEICLADDCEASPTSARFHDKIGWAVFLQEMRGPPRRSARRLPAGEDSLTKTERVDDFVVLELANDLPDIMASHRSFDAMFTLAGCALFVATFETGVRVKAQRLRAYATARAGYELCRVAVREGLLGQRLDGQPLRHRLQAGRRHTPAAGQTPLRSLGADPAAGWQEAVRRALQPGGRGMVLGRHPHAQPGTSGWRAAALPTETADDLADAARAFGQPIVSTADRGARQVLYTPHLLARTSRLRTELRHRAAVWKALKALTAKFTGNRSPGRHYAGFDCHHFETVFASANDPWRCETPYESLKYAQILSLLPDRPLGDALELACAEGRFTVQLARRVERLLATAVAQVALDRSRERCAHLPNVRFALLDITKDPIPGKFDVIVCGEVLYYLQSTKALRRVAREIAKALTPDGILISAHSNMAVDDPASPGFDCAVPFGAKRIGAILGETLQPTRELSTPFYRIQLFQRRRGPSRLFGYLRASSFLDTKEVPHHPPAPDVAAKFLPAGRRVRKDGIPEAATWELPILMYSQIAPTGPAGLARYRLSPAQFEEQLRYLRRCEFRSISLEEWRLAKEAWRPLPGRAVMLTFDDGYADFAEHAFPLLKRYGFSALVFIVTDSVGTTNAWDRHLESPVHLMTWNDIRRLAGAGIEFGSHSASHPFLTALSPPEVVREAVRSRIRMEQELGRPITAFAYPHGAEDPATQHLIGAVGYTYGLSCRPGPAKQVDPLLALPRIEVRRDLSLREVVHNLGQ